MSTNDEFLGRTVQAGLSAVKQVDIALRELGLVSYMASRIGELGQSAEAKEAPKAQRNGKIHPVKAKAKRRSPKGGFWSSLTKAERSAEMARRQAKRYANQARKVVETHSGTFRTDRAVDAGGVNPASGLSD